MSAMALVFAGSGFTDGVETEFLAEKLVGGWWFRDGRQGIRLGVHLALGWRDAGAFAVDDRFVAVPADLGAAP